MNKELVYIGMLGFSSMLFALGGTGRWPLASKLWRRVGVPIVIFFGLLMLGCWHIAAFLSCAALSGFLWMGYGESKTWDYKAMLMVLYVVPTLLIGWTWWLLITPWPILLLFFFLSNVKFLQHDVIWKIWEAMAGFFIAATYIGAMQHYWW